jgi:hypothetical protein
MNTSPRVAALLLTTIGTLAACTTEDREVRTEPEMQSIEAAGEANLEDFPSWRATADPPGGVGPNAEAIIRGGAEGTTIHVDLDGGESGATHPWHIHSGECGDLQPPIVGAADAYPPIVVGEGGEGDAEATIGATLESDGEYILNVHLSSARLDSIVACGEVVKSSSPEY